MMVTGDGVFFHIDYGFVLGEDPKPLLMRNMAISADVIDGMGGRAKHQEFRRLSTQVYNALRRHTNLFVSLLLALPNARPAVDPRLEEQLCERFSVGLSSDEASRRLLGWMDAELGSSRGAITDMLHEAPKSVPIPSITAATQATGRAVFAVGNGLLNMASRGKKYVTGEAAAP